MGMFDGLLHPRWLAGVFLRTLLTSGIPRLENIDSKEQGKTIVTPIEEFRQRRDALRGTLLLARILLVWDRPPVGRRDCVVIVIAPGAATVLAAEALASASSRHRAGGTRRNL